MNVKRKIKILRTKLRMTQLQFANALGMSVSGVANYEGGFREPSKKTASKMIKLAKKEGIEIHFEDIFSE